MKKRIKSKKNKNNTYISKIINSSKKVIDFIKPISSKVLTFIKKYIYILYVSLPLISLDLMTRYFGKDINFYKTFNTPSILFTLAWITLFVGIILSFKKKTSKIIYLIVNILFLTFFLVNSVYYSMTKTFFDFNLLYSASEGAPYILDTIKNCNPIVYLFTIIVIILIIFGYKKIPDKTKNNRILFLSIIIIFIIAHSIIPSSLGKANSELTWSTWRNPRNIYDSFNDSNKSFKISGLYEYIVRNFYITFIKPEKAESEEDTEFLTQAYNQVNELSTNKYTGIFKDKNLIFVQLEGLDNWLFNATDTPVMYSMLNNSINFTNHFSYYNGGGSTFNSEFAVNTGYITPLSYTRNAYSFNKNYFPYSMANIFKKDGYKVNAFHMNNGEYYSRTANYKNWGYENYYGLLDIEKYSDESYTLDRELILNETFNSLIFNQEEKFVDYIIAYSGHLPFSNTKGVCKLLYDLDHAEDDTDTEETEENNEPVERIEMSEEECIRRQAKETDYMMELLLQNLEEKGLIDNTVVIVFTDHYLYTVEDKTILDKYKETSNNLINKTPFFIWSKDMNKATVNKATSQLNILPTVLNLFGFDYNPNNYIGTDALDSNYNPIVFFSDYSWYDGNVYVENGEVTNNKSISEENLADKSYYVNYITKKNDLSLKYNWFKKQ